MLSPNFSILLEFNSRLGNGQAALEDRLESTNRQYGTDRSAELDSAKTLGRSIRSEFPIYERYPDIAYLDSAASSQKAASVINRMREYLSYEHANIHRGAYQLSAEATRSYDEARQKAASFLGAKSEASIVFTKGSTEGINLVSRSLESQFEKGDRILLTKLEHHSNIVPWQLLAERRGLELEFAEITPNAEIDLEDLLGKIRKSKPRLIAVTWVSNAFGSVTPLEQVIAAAREHGAWVLVDASQAVMHFPVDLDALDPDFLVCTGHKLYGPTGIGLLYGRLSLLESMEPFLGGGDMIETVSVSGSTWAKPPRKFEAGTPPIAEAIGLGAAIDFVQSLGLENIARHEVQLFAEAHERLNAESGVKVLGPHASGGEQVSILPFAIEGAHPHDIATFADQYGVQIRSGHHCAMPAMEALGLQSTARASLGVYSDTEDIDKLIEAVRAVREKFS